GRYAAQEQPGMFEWGKVAIDRIGKATFLPHLAEKPGFETAAAEDMVEDKSGDEIGIGALQPDAAKGDNRLRHLEFDRLAGAESPRLRVRHRHRVAPRRQARKRAIDQRGDLRRVDTA